MECPWVSQVCGSRSIWEWWVFTLVSLKWVVLCNGQNSLVNIKGDTVGWRWLYVGCEVVEVWFLVLILSQASSFFLVLSFLPYNMRGPEHWFALIIPECFTEQLDV